MRDMCMVFLWFYLLLKSCTIITIWFFLFTLSVAICHLVYSASPLNFSTLSLYIFNIFYFFLLRCAVLLFHAVVVVASIWFAKTMYVCTIICLSKHSFKLEFLNCCCKHTQAHCVHSPRTKLHWKKLYVSIVTQSTHAYSHARRISLIFRLDIQYMFFSSLFHLSSPFFSLHSLSSSFFLFFFFFFLLPSFSLCVCAFFLLLLLSLFSIWFRSFSSFYFHSNLLTWNIQAKLNEQKKTHNTPALHCRVVINDDAHMNNSRYANELREQRENRHKLKRALLYTHQSFGRHTQECSDTETHTGMCECRRKREAMRESHIRDIGYIWDDMCV